MSDQSLLYLFNIFLHTPALDGLFVFFSTRGYLLFLPFVLLIAIVERDKNRALRDILLILVAFALNDWLSNELKSLTQRPRPCLIHEWVRVAIGCSQSSSMPSSHASNAFAVATVLWHQLGRLKSKLTWRLSAYVIAFCIAYSRLYLGVHYPSDVLAGALLGVVIAVVVVSSWQYFSSLYEKRPAETVLLIMTIGLSLFRIYYIRHGGLDLSPDEAHYWEWSRRLDWSYYSKGPLIAWMIWMSTSVFGDNPLAIRLNAVLLMALSSLILYVLTVEIFKSAFSAKGYNNHGQLVVDAKKAGLVASTLLQLIPLYSTYGIVFTIDSPFVFFWILSLYLFWKALQYQDSWSNWVLLGITIGLGMLAKYTMVFFLICGLTYLSMYDRKKLLTPYPYVTVIIAFVIFSPVILWNAKHDWVTFKHTASQANVHAGLVVEWRRFFEFIASQIGVVSPLLFFMLLFGLFRIKKFSPVWLRGLIWSFSLPVLVFFLLKSLQSKVQTNWAMHGYIVTLISFAILLVADTAKRPIKRWLFGIAVALAVVINLVGLYPQLFKIPVHLDPSARLRGWSTFAQEVDRLAKEFDRDTPFMIITPEYQLSSSLAFYLKDKPTTHCINLGRRMNQYDLWESPQEALKRLRRDQEKVNALFVSSTHFDITGIVAPLCERYEKHTVELHHKGRFLRSYLVIICYNLSSLPPNVETGRY